MAQATEASGARQRNTCEYRGPGDSLGAHFVAWLRSSIQSRRLKINEAKALVHTVAGTAFVVTPGVFQRFIQEHPEVARLPRDPKFDDLNWVQKRFEKLRLHKKQDNGLNIWTCEVTGQRKSRKLHGYLLTDAHTLFDDVPFDNPYLKLLWLPSVVSEKFSRQAASR
jgi:hypothetical protein